MLVAFFGVRGSKFSVQAQVNNPGTYHEDT